MRSTTLHDSFINQLISCLINVLDSHVLLMEDNILGDCWGLNANDVSNTLKDNKTKRHILKEESMVEVKVNIFITSWDVCQVLSFDWDHREGDYSVTLISVEYSFKG